MPTYPMTPKPEDVLAAREAENQNFLFSDIHVRGEYPGYIKRYFAENGIETHFEEGDKEVLKEHTVDFISFSYYMSVTEASNKADYVSGEGNIVGGLENPYLEKSEWGWAIDPKGLRI
ncbi:family 1 glycosylhydrolase, partial [Salmonella enterica]|uniref:family 1 glycosylhydrolase n=1 Tax=Salmonella enterica TaxID=28901 RepID=UPI0020C7BC01